MSLSLTYIVWFWWFPPPPPPHQLQQPLCKCTLCALPSRDSVKVGQLLRLQTLSLSLCPQLFPPVCLIGLVEEQRSALEFSPLSLSLSHVIRHVDSSSGKLPSSLPSLPSSSLWMLNCFKISGAKLSRLEGAKLEKLWRRIFFGHFLRVECKMPKRRISLFSHLRRERESFVKSLLVRFVKCACT